MRSCALGDGTIASRSQMSALRNTVDAIPRSAGFRLRQPADSSSHCPTTHRPDPRKPADSRRPNPPTCSPIKSKPPLVCTTISA